MGQNKKYFTGISHNYKARVKFLLKRDFKDLFQRLHKRLCGLQRLVVLFVVIWLCLIFVLLKSNSDIALTLICPNQDLYCKTFIWRLTYSWIKCLYPFNIYETLLGHEGRELTNSINVVSILRKEDISSLLSAKDLIRRSQQSAPSNSVLSTSEPRHPPLTQPPQDCTVLLPVQKLMSCNLSKGM